MNPKLTKIITIILMSGLILIWVLAGIFSNPNIVNYGLVVIFILFIIFIIADKIIYKKKINNDNNNK